MASHKRWIRADPSAFEQLEIERVDELARQLLDHMGDTSSIVASLHVHSASSKAIQDHFAKLLSGALGFDEEVVLTPQDGLVTRARPDFFYRIGPGRGILAEV